MLRRHETSEEKRYPVSIEVEYEEVS